MAADDLKVAESEAEGQSADGAEPVTESVDVALDKSETREPGELEPSKHEAGTADGREEEGVVVAQTSRPATPDRRNITWEEAGGGAMTREGEGEGEKMRRPSQQSLDRVGVGVSSGGTESRSEMKTCQLTGHLLLPNMDISTPEIRTPH